MQRDMNKLLRRMSLAAGFLTVLLLAAFAVFSTPWFRRFIERRIVLGLEQLTGGRVEIGEFHFKPALFEVTLRHLVIHGLEGPQEPALFAAQTARVRLNPATFIRRRVLLRSLEWHGAEVHVRINPDGASNIPGPRISLPPSEILSEFIDLSVGRLNISQTKFYWNDQVLPLELSSGDVEVVIRSSFRHKYSGRFTSSGLTITAKGWSIPPLDLAANFEFTRRELLVPGWTAQGREFQARGSVELHNFVSPSGYFSIQAKGELPGIGRSLEIRGIREGSASAEGQAVIRNGEVTLQGRMEMSHVLLDTPDFNLGRIGVSLDYRAVRRQIEVTNLKVMALGTETMGRGTILWREPVPEFDFQAQIRPFDLNTVLRSIESPNSIWARQQFAALVQGTGDARWKGRFDELKSGFHLDLRPPDRGLRGGLPLRGAIDGSVASGPGGTVTIQSGSLSTPHSILNFQGTLNDRNSQLAVELSTTDFEEYRPIIQYIAERSEPIPVTLKSTATFWGTATGPFARPEVQGRLKLGAFELSRAQWDGLEADVAVSPTRVQISSGRVWHAASSLMLEANAVLTDWTLHPDAPIQLAVRAEKAPLAGLEKAAGVDIALQGTTSGQLRIDGTLSHLTGSGEITIENGTLLEEPFDTLTTPVKIANSVWSLDGIKLRKDGGKVAGKASFDPAQRAFTLDLTGEGFNLARIQGLGLCMNAERESCPVDGVGSFVLRGRGTANDPQLHLDWAIDRIMFNSLAAGRIWGRADWQGRQIRLQGEGQGAQLGTLLFSGSAKTDGDWPLELTGQFENLRGDALLRASAGAQAGLKITGKGAFALKDPLRDRKRLELDTRIEKLEVRFPDITWTNDLPIECHLINQVITAKRFRMKGPATDLEVEGSLRLGRAPTIAFTMAGQAEATLLTLLDPAIRSTGHSRVQIRGSGDPLHPAFTGTLNVEDVSLTYSDMPFRIGNLNGEIRLDTGRATVKSLRGTSGGGTVSFTGSVTLDTPARINMHMDLEQVRVPYPTDFTSVLSGRLRLEGTSARSQLGGDLTVRHISANDTSSLLNRFIQGGGSFFSQSVGISSPSAASVRLKIQVASAPTVQIETRDLRVSGDVDLTLTGTLQNPVQVGTIHLVSGEAVFRGNRYRLTRGEINMNNPLRTQPVLDLEVQTRVQRYDLTLDISGPFDRLQFVYRSDPPLPTEDVLSLLALGYSRQQQEMATAAGHADTTFGASALLSEALSSQMTGRIQRLFGVSRIRIDPNLGGPGNLSGARVTVEQQITRDLTITYSTNTATSQYRVIQFEYSVNDNLSLLGIRDQNGVFGIEIRHRQRFK
jgi:translocation and assembly module TamB